MLPVVSLDATVAQALSSLDAEGLQMLADTIALMQQADRRKAPGKDAFVAPVNLDHGDTAFVMTCTTLVLLMTIPGLALFYGGLAQAPNVLSTVVQSFSITCVVTLLWLAFGYSMAFDTGNEIIGGPNKIWLQGMINQENGSIPEALYITFQVCLRRIHAREHMRNAMPPGA
jgi:Amt family ammonium transporter